MIPLPPDLEVFRKDALHYLSKRLVKDIEFSDRTYQVQVIDEKTKKEVWAFLQLDARGEIKDSFCSCENDSYCPHIVAAYLRIYNETPWPLHHRFQNSLWNQLCRIYCERLGDKPSMLEKEASGHYFHSSPGGKKVFSIHAKSSEAKKHLTEIIEKRVKATEETSLKFSNLPQEEIILWREGRPSDQLRYELSFWCDIAHWLMFLQDEAVPYEIRFEYSPKRLPNQIIISFSDLELRFYLSEANLPLIIPSLASVKSPLTVHQISQDAIKRITYDKKTQALIIEPLEKLNLKEKPLSNSSKNEGIKLDGWLYIPRDGFYALEKHYLLSKPMLRGKEISEALNEHLPLVQMLLEDTSLDPEPISLSYSINFDPEWNLHIIAYAYTPGDLTGPYAGYFGDWIYLDDEGFYRISEAHFEKAETVIPFNEVSDFVRRERSWLNTQEEGFHVHLASIEQQLTYRVTPENRLIFSRMVPSGDKEIQTKDFGLWIYISGKGFYSKYNSYTRSQLRPDLSINPDQVPLFIRMNSEELQMVPGFFSSRSPITKMSLKISLEDKVIAIEPQYQISRDYAQKEVRFFEDFSYVEGEGFHALPVERNIPEFFRHAMQIDKQEMPYFLDYELEFLEPYAEIDPRLIRPNEIQLFAHHITQAEQQGLYALKLVFHTDRGSVPLDTVWSAIKKKKEFLFSQAGLLDLDDPSYRWIRLLSKDRLDKSSNTLYVSTLELIRLHSLQGLEVAEEADSTSHRLLEELTHFKIPSFPDLTGLKSELRPYQQLGVEWLWFLYHHKLSGLLCDDMGLGKTHQAMALLTAIMNAHKEENEQSLRPHFLIVCPTSVIFHWQEKLHDFLPGVKICTFYGSNRSLEDFHQQYDILLTSYGIWRIENQLLSEVQFDLAIFDEIQIAKNHHSRVHLSLLSAKAKMRLGLTGTPIENHLRELKSLFDIVLPTYMPGDHDYREMFVKPIEKEGDKETQELLQRFIKPFILRRKKETVLLDLPEKTEEIAHCILQPDQQMLYNATLLRSREAILQQLQDDNTNIPYIHVFALLSSLKQICNHPAVFYKTPKEYKKYSSGKWELFEELLNEARESGQKVVVFSQYLAMLDIFEEYLNEQGMGFATIRGSTANRGEQVNRFNKDPSCEVFLGSLQAAGLGVDLTAGSVVIHYDRWWNAARENQATDRVHRIGQQRGVQVFKLVTKDTFEERIDELIAKKGQLMEEVVGVDDHRFLKKFTREELIQLLNLTNG